MEFNFDEVINRSREIVQRTKELTAKTLDKKSQLDQKFKHFIESPNFSTAHTSPRALQSPQHKLRLENALLKKQLLELHKQISQQPTLPDKHTLFQDLDKISQEIHQLQRNSDQLRSENAQLEEKLGRKAELQLQLATAEQNCEQLTHELESLHSPVPRKRLQHLQKKLKSSSKLLNDFEKRFKKLKSR